MRVLKLKGGDVLLDDDDFEKIIGRHWYVNEKGYVVRCITIDGKEGHIKLHEVLMPRHSGLTVDHKDRNKLNNQRNNLRLATATEQRQNSSLSSNNTSGVKGVNYDRKSKKWYAQIGINNKMLNLGYHTEYTDAVIARKNAEEKYYAKIHS